MKITIIPDDHVIILDGEPVFFPSNLFPSVPSDVHAYQWDGDSGEIEYKERGRSNDTFTDVALVSAYQTAHATEKARQIEVAEASEFLSEQEMQRYAEEQAALAAANGWPEYF